MQEHQAVIKALEQLNPSRKCFRLVGEVLVERTVQEVLPAVKNNTEQLEMVHPFALLKHKTTGSVQYKVPKSSSCALYGNLSSWTAML